jgi:hypothetical protein
VLPSVILGAMLVGCTSVPPARLSECPHAGTARYNSIPIASRDEHEQARRFLPSRPEYCAVYVVRESDLWTDRRARRVDVVLTLTGSPIPRLPANPAMLPSVFGNQVLEIHDNVYAMWEMAPGDYLLHAISIAGYGGIYLDQAQRNAGPGMGVSRVLTCASGSVLFFAVGDVGFRHTLVLKDLDPDSGMEYVRNGLRSRGINAGRPGYRDCDLKWEPT